MEGTAFGRYQLLHLLGRGGMGEVWRAHDTDTDRIVAIKVLPADFSENEDFRRRFRREAHAAARLNSPHVIPIHDYGEIDGRLYVNMRLIEGHDLQSVLAAGPLEPARAVRIVGQVAKALHAAHKVGLVHRDVKPSNILLDEDDFAYLIDFGIARAADATRLTKSGNTIGTFHYIAPERLGTGQEEDARADIYSLACVLYECLTGSPPFTGDTMARLVADHLNTPPPQPSTSQPTVPPQLDQVIATGMAKDPDQRYATTVELATAAHDAITTPIPRPVPQPPLQRPPTPAAAMPPGQPPPAPRSGFTSPATQQRPPHEISTRQHQPPARPPGKPASAARPWWRRKAVAIGVAALVAVIAVVAVILSTTGEQREPGQTASPSKPAEPRETTLPFTGLDSPNGVAVDSRGTVYVTDTAHQRVLSLAAGSTSQAVLPFTGLNGPQGVAVDGRGTVYVVDSGHQRVLSLAAGSTSQAVLPFTFAALGTPKGVAVDDTGTVYVTEWSPYGGRVLSLAAGSTSQAVLPFTGVDDPEGVAVDSTGTVYVTDDVGQRGRVLSLAAGSTSQAVLPFSDLDNSADSWNGVAVDGTTVYVADSYKFRVLTLPAGSTSPTVLPFTGLSYPHGVAVDGAGTVYVASSNNDRVVALVAE